jgi:hypothetical protein
MRLLALYPAAVFAITAPPMGAMLFLYFILR